MQVLVVLPVYNEEENLKILIPKILAISDYLKILIVNDCSGDRSLEVAESFKRDNPERIFIISHKKHLGRGAAVKNGYNFAVDRNFEFLIEMDADLSHRPEDISSLLKEAGGIDIVIGSRLIKKGCIYGRSFLRNLITYISNIYLRFILGLKEIKDVTSGFRCINVEFLRKTNLCFLKSNGPQLLQELIFKNKNNIRIKEAPIVFENRYRGKSKFSLSIIFKSIWLSLYLRIENLLFFFILTTVFFLRLYHLGYHDFWYDEMWSISYARYPWRNWNAPFYWIPLHFWTKIFGYSEFSLRFPSLVFSFLSVILTFFLGRELFNKKVGIIASILMGLSPFHLWYAQEARDYSMVLFLGMLSSYLFFKAIKEERFKIWLSFVLVSLLGLYTNYFYIFLFAAQGLYFIFSKRLKLNFKEIICFLIIILGFSFYLPRFLSKFFYVWHGFWIPKPTWRSLIITIENFILGYNGSPSIYLISNALVSLFLISALWTVHNKELRISLIFCVFLSFIPLLFAFFFSRLLFSVYLDRGLIIFSPYLYLILSLGLNALKKNIKVVSFLALISILFISDYRYFKDFLYAPTSHHTGTYIKKPIKPSIRFLEDNLELQDVIAFTNESTMPLVKYYIKKESFPIYFFFDSNIADSSWQRPIQEGRFYVSLYKITHLKFKRLWLISSDWARSGNLDKNSQVVKDWLDKKFSLEFAKELDGLWIFRYAGS